MIFLLFTALTAAPPEVVVQSGHSIIDAALSDDHRFILSGGEHTLKLWDVASGKLIRTIGGHRTQVGSVAISHDGRWLASGTDADESEDAVVQIFDAQTGKLFKKVLSARRAIYALTFTPDGAHLLAAVGRTVKFLNTKTGDEDAAFSGYPETNQVRFAFDARGQRVAIAFADVTKIWDLKKANLLATVKPSVGEVSALAFSADGRSLLVAGATGAALVDSHSGAVSKAISTEATTAVAFAAGGKAIALAHPDATALVSAASFAAQRPRATTTVTGHKTIASQDGKLFVRFGPVISLIDTMTGETVRQLRGQTVDVDRFALSPDDSTLITAGGQVWDLARGKIVRAIDQACTFLDYADASTYLCATSSGVTRRASADGHVITTYTPAEIQSYALSRDGKRFATAGDKDIIVWDAATGKKVAAFPPVPAHVRSLTFSADGTQLVSGEASLDIGNNAARLWDIASRKEVNDHVAHHGFAVEALAVSHDGALLATGSWDPFAGLWDVHDGRQRGQFTGHTTRINAVAFSPDDKLLASGSADGHAKLWDTETQKETADIAHDGEVIQVSFSHDGKWVLTSGGGALRMTDAHTGAVIATMISTGGTEYVTVTGDGFYRASKNALAGVAFRQNNLAYPFEQFDLALNRPDRVLAAIGRSPKALQSAYQAAYRKRLQKLHVAEAQLRLDYRLPEIALLTAPPLASAVRAVTLRVRASDPGAALARLHLVVNGVPVYGMQGLDLQAIGQKSVERAITFTLSQGKNAVQVAVANNLGTESLRQSFVITYTGPVVPAKLYAVTIGVSKYKDAQYNLDYAAKDASDLGRLLSAEGHAALTTVLDADATRERVLALKQALAATAVDDEVVVFVAGHGLLDDKLDYYFATSDIDFAHPALAGLLYDDLEGLLDGIPARKKLLLMDTCHAGEVDKENTQAAPPMATVKKREVGNRGIKAVATLPNAAELNELLGELFADLRRGSGAIVIASSGGAQFAQESGAYKNGVFTYAVIDGVRSHKADANKDGSVSVAELRDYVSEEVPKMTAGEQKPTTRRDTVEYDFPLY